MKALSQEGPGRPGRQPPLPAGQAQHGKPRLHRQAAHAPGAPGLSRCGASPRSFQGGRHTSQRHFPPPPPCQTPYIGGGAHQARPLRGARPEAVLFCPKELND
ncbi:hypothetical protein AV530_017593 [Patagioenas fasciata monilis]|uniref:Uncharacterized protein n=1 Tax=Patagioenas fasciata monilis TaxID=372326 RepID=A0A1V4J990_PATFA|nr:hypothetical protein AV530_017593 [Patagioenas fasciata monilis]